MPSKSFSLEPGGAKRLELRWKMRWNHLVVCLDDQVVEHVDGGAKALRAGRELTLPGGARLRVQLMSTFMGPQLALHLDGQPVAGSAAVALPKWSYAFIGACALIPLLTMGGAIPAAIGFGGAAGVAAIARDDTKGAGMRVALSAGIAGACWVALLLFLTAVSRAQR